MPFILRKTITETFLARARQSGSEPSFQFRPTDSDGDDVLGGPPDWKEISFPEFFNLTRILSFGLMSLGIRPGDKVAILSHTRIEWSAIDMAILGARAVTVPIYPSSAATDVVRILNHSESRVVFVENAVQLEKILQAREADPRCLPGLEKIIVLEAAAMKLAVNPQQNVTDVLTLRALRELGKREEGKTPKRFEENLSSAQPSDLITICYTTGTTGDPKGVPLAHENLMSAIEDCIQRMNRRIRPDREVFLTILPFSHVLGKVESMIFYAVGGKLAYSEGPDRLATNLQEVRPTLLFAVPRFFEKAYSQVQTVVDAGNIVNRHVFEWALKTGRRYHDAFRSKKNPSLTAIAQYALAKQLVFGRITDRFGGRLRYAISGGAPLGRELGEFFEIAGIRILEGYGLTETCAPVTLNDPDRPRFGTVGRPLPDVSIRIAEDGEILLKSRRVFSGYYKDPKETERVLRDGWFYTGDIGYIDHDGFLHITDRKKDLIITSTGKNIAPQKIENLAKAFPMIREIVVYGDRRSYLTALITLDREMAIQYANSHHILFSEYSELIKNPKIMSWVGKTIDEVNRQLSSFETIKKFMVLPDDFTVEGGELTSSLKVRRNVIYRRFDAEFDSLYK